MSEYQKRQTYQIIESIKSYKVGQLTLNKLVLKLEALVAFNEMSDIRKAVGEKLAILEEINAYLLEGGQNSEVITTKIESILSEIETNVQF